MRLKWRWRRSGCSADACRTHVDPCEQHATEVRTENTSMISMAGGLGFEPRLTESESAVLPLNYPPKLFHFKVLAFSSSRKPLYSPGGRASSLTRRRAAGDRACTSSPSLGRSPGRPRRHRACASPQPADRGHGPGPLRIACARPCQHTRAAVVVSVCGSFVARRR